MSESCTAMPSPSISPGARTCTSSSGRAGSDLHQIIGAVCSRHPTGTAKWLQRVTGRSARTVKYWLAGAYCPRGNAGLKIAAALRAELDADRERLQQFELQF